MTAVVNRDSFQSPTSSSSRDRFFVSSGNSDIPSMLKKNLALFIRIKLVEKSCVNVHSVAMAPLASRNLSHPIVTTLMLDSPGLPLLPIWRTVGLRELWSIVLRTRSIVACEGDGGKWIKRLNLTRIQLRNCDLMWHFLKYCLPDNKKSLTLLRSKESQ